MNRVTSKDGTQIAFDRAGTGPAIILVGGGGAVDRSENAALAEKLADHFTVVNYDRRGRGDSGDSSAYAVQREVEDIAALIEAVGGAAAVYGQNGDDVAGLRGTATWVLADGRRIAVEADGRFDRPYEPFHRGGLSQVRVRTDDGREGTAIFEVTGARHHRYFPDAAVPGPLPR